MIISTRDKQEESAEGQFYLVFIYHVENLEELAILDKENKITFKQLVEKGKWKKAKILTNAP